MKTQKRLIVSLVSALIIGGASSLALAHDCGEPACAQRHNHSWQDHKRWDKSDCRHRHSWQDRKRWDKSDCRHKSHKSRHTSARWEREASRVLSEIDREIDALTHRQEKYRHRRSCCDHDRNRQNW